MKAILYFLIFAMGTVFGSFSTLAIYRIPLKKNITTERSFCPNCNHKLAFFDLIPVLSYIFLGGKCRYCGKKIKPTYYYISKDGKDYVDNITLYYKNSEGKYVTFENSNYILYFKPNDGYRFKLNSSVTNKTDVMSTQLEPLEISSKEGFYLNYKMMNSSNNYFIQSWYGEFKLPNSTIAVGGKKSNISNSLKDGYIGVKFNISCIDKKDTINYNTNNHNVKDEKTNQVKPNTSQWDYEGYLGFREPGNQAGDIPIQLEKGIWIVNDNNDSSRTSKATYNDIKGTVVLFDLDNRAANDFD